MIDKFQASLLGYAIGDALAAPVEDVYRSPEEGDEPVTFYVKAFPSHPVSHLRPGQYSDETQIMLVLAKSLVEKGSFSIDDLSHKLVDWFYLQKKRSEWRFPGNTLVKSCRKLASGSPWSQAGHLSAGVNAVCRTLPYALAFFRSPSLLKNAVDKSCRITHTDQKVLGTSLAFASVIALGLEGAEFSTDYIMNRAIEKAQPYASEMVKKMKAVKDSLKLDTKVAIENIGNSGYCLDSFAAALYWFLKSEGRFDEMVIGAANAGGDADAIAAMAGAMFGAWFGLGAIPEKWFAPLEDFQIIRQLGCDIYRMAQPQS
ncbi:MAG: ADP-ribosylglycohydrolase family protein [Candidatus Riflebacteria bacterium]|nr:ADP-ribosylglycohydrolase family protein [Candidatus Riflebacteria bacterium]